MAYAYTRIDLRTLRTRGRRGACDVRRRTGFPCTDCMRDHLVEAEPQLRREHAQPHLPAAGPRLTAAGTCAARYHRTRQMPASTVAAWSLYSALHCTRASLGSEQPLRRCHLSSLLLLLSLSLSIFRRVTYTVTRAPSVVLFYMLDEDDHIMGGEANCVAALILKPINSGVCIAMVVWALFFFSRRLVFLLLPKVDSQSNRN